jgi:hypothetical protein
VLTTWPNGTIQWLEIVWPETEPLPADTLWQVEPTAAAVITTPVAALELYDLATSAKVSGALVRQGERALTLNGEGNWGLHYLRNLAAIPYSITPFLTDEQGITHNLVAHSYRVARSGPWQITSCVEGRVAESDLRFSAEIDVFAPSEAVRVAITLHNPRRAKHPDGYWDLGDPGSILFRSLTLDVRYASAAPPLFRELSWRCEPHYATERGACELWQLAQHSSGGPAWQSVNHVDHRGELPFTQRGYHLTCGEQQSTGERASPVVALASEQGHVACAIEDYWQKFPTAIKADTSGFQLELFPQRDSTLPHELQAGEQTTRVAWVACSSPEADPISPLLSVFAPVVVAPTNEAMQQSGVVWHYPQPHHTDRPELRQVQVAALEGPRSFFAKREVIDEYGWRNFGDMWADHEEAYAVDPRPVVSHYNNQYDLLHSLLVQWLRSGDQRWWELAHPLARHVMEIDIYHTTRDKPAYNGGLFWHTAHYHAVGRATHRCMSSSMRGKSIPAPGAGPCNEHNYSTGLWLYYGLTGDPLARQCVLQLAQWVIAMDDGRQHLLGLVSHAPTGAASSTCEPSFHGPGRGAGNSLQSLLNGWLLSHDVRFLTKAAELVERCIHPHDDFSQLQLENAERRWSYTVFLQAIMRLEQTTADCAAMDEVRSYIRACIRHYAQWMAAHERFYLDTPEELEYPTETWAAQELRKGTVLLMAAQYAVADDEAALWQTRGQAMLDRAWNALLSYPTYDTTRPLAVALQQGYLETALRGDTESNVNRQSMNDDVALPSQRKRGSPSEFISQKQEIRQLLRSPWRWPSVLPRLARPAAWHNAWKQSWWAEQLRCWRGDMK